MVQTALTLALLVGAAAMVPFLAAFAKTGWRAVQAPARVRLRPLPIPC